MSEEEKEVIEFLKHSIFEYEEIDTSVLEYIDKNHKIIYKLILKQQKEIEKLKDEYKREVFEHQEFVEDTKVAVQDYIKKYKIKDIISEFIPKSNHEVVLITKIKELLGE